MAAKRFLALGCLELLSNTSSMVGCDCIRGNVFIGVGGTGESFDVAFHRFRFD